MVAARDCIQQHEGGLRQPGILLEGIFSGLDAAPPRGEMLFDAGHCGRKPRIVRHGAAERRYRPACGAVHARKFLRRPPVKSAGVIPEGIIDAFADPRRPPPPSSARAVVAKLLRQLRRAEQPGAADDGVGKVISQLLRRFPVIRAGTGKAGFRVQHG